MAGVVCHPLCHAYGLSDDGGCWVAEDEPRDGYKVPARCFEGAVGMLHKHRVLAAEAGKKKERCFAAGRVSKQQECRVFSAVGGRKQMGYRVLAAEGDEKEGRCFVAVAQCKVRAQA